MSWSATELAPALSKLGIDAFDAPERLPWLVLLAAACTALALLRRPPTLPWPGLPEVRRAGGRAFDPLRATALSLRGLGLLCLALALCGPVSLTRAAPEPGLGLDLMLVLDASGSMRALDTLTEGHTRSRMDLARDVVTRFAAQRVAQGDRVGLVVFGESAFTQCPLTGDGALLAAALSRVAVGMVGETTALGDALALAVKRVTGPARAGAAGRAVVLLTDGRSNAGEFPIDVATALAAAANVRVHAVGIGRGGRPVAMEARSAGVRGGLRFERHDPDFELLQRIATDTGGRAYRALRPAELEPVYAEIDALERVERPLPPRPRRTGRSEPLVAAAGAALWIEIGLMRSFRRRLP